jgi:hypothetical protein
MKHALAIDRFEGELAVLLDAEGRILQIPRDLLPKGCKPGEMLTLRFERDREATRHLAQATRKVQKDLERTDPGGDLVV